MPIGANISIIAGGAILAFATHVHTSGISVVAVGAILMTVGAVALVMQLSALARQRGLTVDQAIAGRPVVVRAEARTGAVGGGLPIPATPVVPAGPGAPLPPNLPGPASMPSAEQPGGEW